MTNKMHNAFANPEYMSFDEVQKILKSNSRLGPPPNHRPPPPPCTPPVIKHRRQAPRIPLYQNVNIESEESNLISEISSNSSSSNATMIIRKSPPGSSLFESDDSLCSMIVKDDPSPPRPIIKTNTPIIINRLANLDTPIIKKRMGSISPIMTSSRADLNFNTKTNLINVFCDIEEEINILEPTLIQSPPPPPSIANIFNNVNYYYVPNSLNSSSDQLCSDNSETESSLCSLILQPPSPFKSPKQSCLKLEKPLNSKKVSFLINNSVSSRSSTSSCSSISSVSSSEVVLQGPVKELDLIQEKIFTKIFANQDYFVSDLINKIESASSSSIPSSCASSTSSQSSGYKSCQSSNTSKIINQSSFELKEFIDTNRDRLDRLKIRRNQTNAL